MSIIIGSIFIGIGIILIRINNHLKGKTKGSIVEADCNTNTKSCLSTISYNVNNVDYTNKKTTDIVNKGESLDILYDTTNPNNFEINRYIISSIGWLIFSLMFKPIAAATGVGAVADALIPDINLE